MQTLKQNCLTMLICITNGYYYLRTITFSSARRAVTDYSVLYRIIIIPIF